MPNVHRLLPRLTVNRRLLQAVIDERRACCALSLVEERRQFRPAVFLGLPQMQDLAQLGDGFRLGHQVAFTGGVQALRLDFTFQGLRPLQVVLDPANETVRHVLSALAEAEVYFILVIGNQGVTAFRADPGQEERNRFADLLSHTAAGAAESRRFVGLERALQVQAPDAVPLVVLGQDDPSLLDLSDAERYELRPTH